MSYFFVSDKRGLDKSFGPFLTVEEAERWARKITTPDNRHIYGTVAKIWKGDPWFLRLQNRPTGVTEWPAKLIKTIKG